MVQKDKANAAQPLVWAKGATDNQNEHRDRLTTASHPPRTGEKRFKNPEFNAKF